MADTAHAFETAVAHHRAGRFVEAANLYRKVLEADPRHVDALHLLGVAAHQSGQHETAVAYISRAIMLRGGDAAFHSNLGEVYRAAGKLDEAARCYQQALRLDPALAACHNNLGTLYQQRGEHQQAVASFREALRLQPAYPDALNNLGISLRQLGNLAGAVEQFRKALQIDPCFSRAYDNLGTTLKLQGDLAGAVECYREALRRDPGNASYHFNLGVLYQHAREYEEAVDCYRESLRLNPAFAEGHNNLGTVLKELGRHDEALASYRIALELQPNLAEAYYNIGIVHTAEGRMADAVEAYRKALAIQPNYVKALINYGGLIQDLGRLDEALTCFQRVIELEPNLAMAHFSYGNICRHRRTLAEAIAAYQKAISLQPDYADAFNNLAATYTDAGQPELGERCCRKGLEYAPTLSPLYSNLAIALLAEGRIEEALVERRKALSMRPTDAVEHSNLVYDLNFVPGVDPPTIFAEHLDWAHRHAEPHTAAAAPHANHRDPERRLRIGYVSPYFRVHAVNYFTEPILLAHDHREFEIYCYSDVLRPDETTERLKAAADCWRDIYPLTMPQLADLVRADAIDILVDLTGHIGMNRLPAFARKPAPVQVTYIGYQNTTGMTAMDYRLTDAQADPPGLTDRFHTETLVRLPRSFFCYRANDDAPPITPLPALARGHVTFGSFNKYVKVNPQVIDAWLRILARVPDARLLVLANTGGYAQEHLHASAKAQGIDPARIEVLDKLPHAEYMQLLARADIALDPFPFTGHTTTCDCVWMGVPVVMLQGQTYVTRFGGSVLVNVGLESWIADTVDEYVDIAVRAAGDLQSLARLRAELRPRMAASPLSDFAGFTRNLEMAYRHMWRAWCAGRRWQPDAYSHSP